VRNNILHFIKSKANDLATTSQIPPTLTKQFSQNKQLPFEFFCCLQLSHEEEATIPNNMNALITKKCGNLEMAKGMHRKEHQVSIIEQTAK
jgi:hypothetical protein